VGETARRKAGNTAFGGREQNALRKTPAESVAAVLARVPPGTSADLAPVLGKRGSLLPHAQVHATSASTRTGRQAAQICARLVRAIARSCRIGHAPGQAESSQRRPTRSFAASTGTSPNGTCRPVTPHQVDGRPRATSIDGVTLSDGEASRKRSPSRLAQVPQRLPWLMAARRSGNLSPREPGHAASGGRVLTGFGGRGAAGAGRRGLLRWPGAPARPGGPGQSTSHR
jgi:hypothetical protein